MNRLSNYIMFFLMFASSAYGVWNDYVWDLGAGTQDFSEAVNWSPGHVWDFTTGEDQAAIINYTGSQSPIIGPDFSGHPDDFWLKIGTNLGAGELTIDTGANVEAGNVHMPWTWQEGTSTLNINSGATLNAGTLQFARSGTAGSISNLNVSGDLIADRIICLLSGSETNVNINNGNVQLSQYFQTNMDGTLNLSLDGAGASLSCPYMTYKEDPNVVWELEFVLDGEAGVGGIDGGSEIPLPADTSLEVSFNSMSVPGEYTVMAASDIIDANGNMLSTDLIDQGWSYAIVDNKGIDELRVYYTPVDSYYDIINDDNPAVWLRLNDKYDLHGDIAQDNQANLNGIFQGNISVLDVGVKKAAWFNGFDAAVDLGAGLRGILDGASAVSVEAWINPVNPEPGYPYAPIVGYRINNGSAGLDLRLKYSLGDVVLIAGVRSTESDTYQTRQIPVSLEGSWHHVVCVVDYSAETLKFYIDGSNIATWDDLNFESSTYSPGNEVTQTDRIGSDCSGSYYYRGFIDETAIYTRKLQSSEISEHANMYLHEYSKWDAQIADNGGVDVTLHDLGSPSIIRASDGNLIATYGHGGPNAPPDAVTTVCRSTNDGKTWHQISQPTYQAKSTIFELNGNLYLLGLGKGSERDIHIKRSEDNGQTWTITKSSETGRLLTAEHSGNNYGFHTDTTSMIDYNGRIYKAFEQETQSGNQWPKDFAAFVLSAPNDCNLLDASNWTKSNMVNFNPNWVGSDWYRPGWLEGGMVVGPDEKLYIMIRVNSEPYVNIAALLEVSTDGTTVTFDPGTGFIDFPGGMAKFNVRYDPLSEKYLALVNNNIDPNGSVTQRNMVTLVASDDLRNWDIVKNVVHCDRLLKWNDSLMSTGFQYIDWQIDGDDIIFVSRTAYDSNTSNPDKAWHDANRITFHRIKNYLDYVAPCGTWSYLDTDYNQDCYVDFMDLIEITENWIISYDLLDYALLAEQWLMCTEPFKDNCEYEH